MTEFTIYSIGDSAFLEQVLIAVAMIFNQDPDVSLITQAIKIGLVISVFVAAFSVIASGGKGMEWQWVLVGLLIYATMFIPKAKVIIEDNYTGDVRIVENVPIGPAAAGGVISAIGLKLTETFEVAYGPIVPKVTETQFAESLKLLTDVRELGNSEAIWMGLNADHGGGFIDIRQSWANYIQDCSLRKIDLGMATADQFITSNASAMLKLDSNLYGTKVFLDAADSQGSFETCTDAWDLLVDNADSATDLSGANAQNAVKSLLGLNASNLASDGSDTATTKLSASLQAVMGSAVDASNYMLLGLVEPVLMQATAAKYDSFQDVNGSLMVNQAIAQRNTQWATEQTLFMSIVRPMMAFFEAFLFAIAPIMAFVIVMGQKGIQLAGKYFAMAIWIQLWLPILAIVNLYIHTAASREVQAYNSIATHNWDSIYALNSASDVMQNWIATGGVLAASTPALALMLIYGSAITATHLAGRLQGGDSINEKLATPDVRSTAPMANIAPMYSGNSVSGMGTEGYAGYATISFGNAIANMQRSTKSEAETANQTWQSSLVEAHSRAEQGVLGERMINATQRAVASMDSESRTAIVDEARARMEDGTYTHGNEEQAVAAVALGAAAGVKAGGGKGPAGGGLEGGINSSDRNVSTTVLSTSSGGSWRTGASLSDSDSAALNRSVQEMAASDTTAGKTTTWNEQTGETFQSTASNALSKTKAYEDASSLATTLQNTTGRTSDALAGTMFENGQENGNAGVNYLNQSMQHVPQSVRAEAQRLENQFVSQGLDEDRARVAANLQALTSEGAYGKDSAQFARGAAIAATALQMAGMGNYGSTGDHSANQGIVKDADLPGVDSRAYGLAGPDMSSQPEVSQVEGDPTAQYHNTKATVGKVGNAQMDNVEGNRQAEARAALEGFQGTYNPVQDAHQWIERNVSNAGQALETMTRAIPEEKLAEFGVDGTFAHLNQDGSYNPKSLTYDQRRDATSAAVQAQSAMAQRAELSQAETEYFSHNYGFTEALFNDHQNSIDEMYKEYGQRYGDADGNRTEQSDFLAQKAMAAMDQAATQANSGGLAILTNLQRQGN